MTTDAPLIDNRTALVLIDLQNGIVSRQTAPYAADDVVRTSRELAEAFRARGLPVVLVTVGWANDMADAPRQRFSAPIAAPDEPGWFAAISPALGMTETDICVRKHQWGAFHGTDLDVQLCRRDIRTIVLAGIATNMGVESTARAAWEHGYSIIFAEDATTSFGIDMHAFAFQTIFPRIGLVSSAAEILADMKRATPKP